MQTMSQHLFMKKNAMLLINHIFMVILLDMKL